MFCRSARGVIALAALCCVCFASAAAQAATIADRSAPSSAKRSDAWIGTEADRLSGRSLVVSCAGSAGGWAQALQAVGLPPAAADEYDGFSLIQSGEMHLSPYVCNGLRLGLTPSTRRSNELQVAWAADVLVHESVHMGRFTADEALTEACARAGLPVELHRLYGVAYHSVELERLTKAAALVRRTMGLAYQGGVCLPAGG
jgi:hypothetical protein